MGCRLRVTGQTLEVRGSRLEAMSINMFEVEGGRLKAKVKKKFCLKPKTSNLKQFFAMRYLSSVVPHKAGRRMDAPCLINRR